MHGGTRLTEYIRPCGLEDRWALHVDIIAPCRGGLGVKEIRTGEQRRATRPAMAQRCPYIRTPPSTILMDSNLHLFACSRAVGSVSTVRNQHGSNPAARRPRLRNSNRQRLGETSEELCATWSRTRASEGSSNLNARRKNARRKVALATSSLA